MIALAILCGLTATACVTPDLNRRVGDLTLVSNTNVEGLKILETGVYGSHCVLQPDYPTIEAAVEEAQRKVPGATALANVTVTLRVSQGGIPPHQICWIVNGDAVRMGGR